MSCFVAGAKNLRITHVILHGMQLKCGSVLADMTEINVYV